MLMVYTHYYLCNFSHFSICIFSFDWSDFMLKHLFILIFIWFYCTVYRIVVFFLLLLCLLWNGLMHIVNNHVILCTHCYAHAERYALILRQRGVFVAVVVIAVVIIIVCAYPCTIFLFLITSLTLFLHSWICFEGEINVA